MKTEEELKAETDATEQKPEDKTSEDKSAEEKKTSEEKEGEHLTQEAITMHDDFDKKIDEEDVPEVKEDKKDGDKKDEKKTDTSDGKPAGEDKGADETDSGTGEKEIEEALLERAVKAGLSIGDAKKFGTDALEITVGMLEAKKPADDSSSDDTPTKEEKEVAEKKAAEDAKPFDCGLDPKEYEEPLIEAINKMGQQFTDKISGLEKDNAELKTERADNAKDAEDKANDEYTSWLDTQFKATGKDFVDVFGEGAIDKLKDGSEEFKNRAKIDSKIQLLVAGYKGTKQILPSREELFQEALSTVFSEKAKQVAVGSTTEKLNKRAKQTIGQGSKGGGAKTGMEEALRLSRDFDNKIDED